MARVIPSGIQSFSVAKGSRGHPTCPWGDKGRPRWTMRGRKTRLPPTPSFVMPHCRCRCPLPWSPYTSPAIAQRAPAETDNAPDLSKRTSRGRHNGGRVRVIHVRLHSFEGPGIMPRLPASGSLAHIVRRRMLMIFWYFEDVNILRTQVIHQTTPSY